MITVPSICEPLTAQPISLCFEKFEHLKQLDMADYSNGQDSLQIDVLIGADYYWELVTGRTSRSEGMSSSGQTTTGNSLLDVRAEVKVALLRCTPDLDGYFVDPYPRRSDPRAPQAF